VLRIEVIIGVIASSIAILGFMARAYANLRRGNRMKRYREQIGGSADEEMRRIQEEMERLRQTSNGE
jgi:hypothetical protein